MADSGPARLIGSLSPIPPRKPAEQLATKSFNVVLIDLKLPGDEGGEDVFRIVRQSNPNTRRILITGFRDESLQTIEGLMQEGVDAVCYKPIDVDNLLDMLAR